MKKITSLVLLALLSLSGHSQNNSLSFDNFDDHVSLGDNFAFNHTDSFSVEAWIKLGDTNQQQIISKIGNETGNIRGWGMQISAEGNIAAYVASAWSTDMVYVSGVSLITINEWHHVAMTFNGSNTLTLFLDGGIEPLGTVFSAGTLTSLQTTASTLIGSADYNGAPTSFFNGSIDDLRIWNTRRTPSEIKSNFQSELSGNEANLIGYYKFDNTSSGCDIDDCSPSLAHGTRNGTGGPNNLPQFTTDVPVIADVDCGAVFMCALGIDDNDVTGMALFPNPTKGPLNILGQNLNNTKVEIYGLLGNLVATEIIENNAIDVSLLPAGMYFIHIQSGRISKVFKIIKQ